MAIARIILGIDPGTAVMGYGVVRQAVQQLSVLQHGVIHLHRYADHALKLKHIFERIVALVDTYNPSEMALEAPFYGKNVQSMLKLGRAQGVAMAAALVKNLPTTEYAPRKIKLAITGNGHASKQQVAYMLASLLKLPAIPQLLDASDALAVAVCHAYQEKKVSTETTTWGRFIQANPARVLNPTQI